MLPNLCDCGSVVDHGDTPFVTSTSCTARRYEPRSLDVALMKDTRRVWHDLTLGACVLKCTRRRKPLRARLLITPAKEGGSGSLSRQAPRYLTLRLGRSARAAAQHCQHQSTTSSPPFSGFAPSLLVAEPSRWLVTVAPACVRQFAGPLCQRRSFFNNYPPLL